MSLADELKKLAELKESGVLSPEEFEQEKTKLLAGSASPPPNQPTPTSTNQKSMATKDIGCLGGLYGVAAFGGLALIVAGNAIDSGTMQMMGLFFLIAGGPLLFVRLRYMWSGTDKQ